MEPSKLCQMLRSQQRMVLVLRPPLGLSLVALAQHCKCMLCWLHPNVGLQPATSHMLPAREWLMFTLRLPAATPTTANSTRLIICAGIDQGQGFPLDWKKKLQKPLGLLR